MTNKEIILILAAGQLPDRQLGPAPLLNEHPLDLPAGSDLAVQRIIHFYRENGPKSQLIAVIDNYSKWHYNCLSSQLDGILQIAPQASAGDSLMRALTKVDRNAEIILNPITSLPNKFLTQSCAIVISEKEQPRENWSAFTKLEPKGPEDLLSKLFNINQKEGKSYPFTGILRARCDQLQEVLEGMELNQRKDLAYVAAELVKSYQAQVICSQWHDLGHRATYARSRREHLVSRMHNTVTYDSHADVIQKTSQDNKRLREEAEYLKRVPKSLQHFFPRVLSDDINRGVRLEYIPYPSLAELFLHWKAGWSGWDRIFKRLGWILDELTTNSQPIIASPAWLYSAKLQTRLQQLQRTPPSSDWEIFWNTPLKVNGIHLPSPKICSDILQNALIPIEKDRPLVQIHGDLCFNNVLADPLHGTVRLIDPRGEKSPDIGVPLGYGDQRYELVKLSHSGIYLYDSVVQGFYTLRVEDTDNVHGDQSQNKWSAKIFPPKHYQLVNQLLSELVQSKNLHSEEQRWLSASLFFSMLPLHGDSVLRQKMFTLIGCCLVKDTFSLLLPCENH